MGRGTNVANVVGTGLRQFSGILSVTDISGNNLGTLSSNNLVFGNTVGNPALNFAGSGGINLLGGGTVAFNGKMFGGAQGLEMTPSSGSFNATFTGPFTSPVSSTLNWVKQGREVTLHIPRTSGPPPAVGTNSATAPAGTVPAALIPINAGPPTDPTSFVFVAVSMFTNNAFQLVNPTYFGIGSDGSILVVSGANWVTTGIGASGGWSATSMRYQTAS